jgi:hypothetical protein
LDLFLSLFSDRYILIKKLIRRILVWVFYLSK